jgi:ABC-type glucose/galactose transport system permease subunit
MKYTLIDLATCTVGGLILWAGGGWIGCIAGMILWTVVAGCVWWQTFMTHSPIPKYKDYIMAPFTLLLGFIGLIAMGFK